ncbi:hypothetical protein QBC32DRAFT_346129 [Pseudoneurospora amorphoporcata]|uniref:DUF1996 domain-containing protein n=1 Tax=Pseudoneurospora amorphoporcata TaxID=241081 RepID=A0AAN6SF07_9PEZI|nr:hypothetical protein QBC32DRAFT_346129 [Pseudoneurospora amorphoporcata]
MLRFACSQLVIDRVDPLVNPGLRYTPHLHQIVGGNSFDLTMDPNSHDLAWPASRPARRAASPRICPTSGRPSCSSRLRTVATTACPRSVTAVLRAHSSRVVLMCIISLAARLLLLSR